MTREEFLESRGWKLTFDAPTMKKWDLFTEFTHYELYAHFPDDGDKPYCNLYYTSGDDCFVFSWRNMKSMIEKLTT